MKIYIVIPVYNEAAYLDQMLASMVAQEQRPNLIMVVNDNSTDHSAAIIENYTSKYAFIQSVFRSSKGDHQPGSKIVEAFYAGLNALPKDYDLIGKFDADIILPPNYIKEVAAMFANDPHLGIAGGNLYIAHKSGWVYENISEKTKVRGPVKLYRAACFEAIGGLKRSIGWDTVDELLAQFHSWKIATNQTLKVKHLKPTGAVYQPSARLKQGQAFKKMRYGFWLTLLASLKLAVKKRRPSLAWFCLRGYFSIKNDYIVTEEEGEFIKKLRWKGIRSKFF